MKETGTEVNEQTMKKLLTAAWKETEKEHKNYVAERIKRRKEKLNEAYSSNGKYLHLDQTGRPDTDCNNEDNRRIHHDELTSKRFTRHSSRRGDRFSPGGSHVTPTLKSVLDDSLRESRWMQRGSLQWNCETQSSACRTTLQREQTHGRNANGNKFMDTMYDKVAEYLNNIEETPCETNHKKLIETRIWPEDVRTTPAANIMKEAESPGPRVAATLHCAWTSTRYRGADDVDKAGVAPHNCARKNSRSQSAECYLATLVEDGGHDEG